MIKEHESINPMLKKVFPLDVLGVVTEDLGISEIVTKSTGKPVSVNLYYNC